LGIDDSQRIDVVLKVDLGIVDGARERLVHILEAEGRGQYDLHFIELSIKEGAGVEELRQEVSARFVSSSMPCRPRTKGAPEQCE
jgi:hypothetical protein